MTKHCFDSPVVCNTHNADADEDVLESYRQQQVLSAAESLDFNFTEVEIPEDLSLAAVALMEKILYQVGVASNIYVAYLCVAFFFPSSLPLFRSPPKIKLKRAIFGANKHLFIVVVIAIWWGYEYFRILWLSPEMDLYIKNLQRNPCCLDQTFVQARKDELQVLCEELGPMEARFRSETPAIGTSWLSPVFC